MGRILPFVVTRELTESWKSNTNDRRRTRFFLPPQPSLGPADNSRRKKQNPCSGSCVEVIALLTSGVRGQNGQDGWRLLQKANEMQSSITERSASSLGGLFIRYLRPLEVILVQVKRKVWTMLFARRQNLQSGPLCLFVRLRSGATWRSQGHVGVCHSPPLPARAFLCSDAPEERRALKDNLMLEGWNSY